ncbi:hypothetical protein R1sor_006398 [Riccia sorocarpa]|uniref:Uncharacterized protein n=1 Tax=Riccia sorocarpa TaxID=122646 RepID=A0ABD3HMI0_9MARC
MYVKKARDFYKSTGTCLTNEEIPASLTLEQKMNLMCQYFFRMHALFGGRANIEPHAVGDAVDMLFDIRDLCQDLQLAFSVPAADPLLSGEEEEEAADKEEEPIDLSEDDDVVDNQTAAVTDGDEFYRTAMPEEDGGLEMGNQTARSAVDVEAIATEIPAENQRPQQSKGGESVQSKSMSGLAERVEEVEGHERKTSLIIAYYEQVKEKLILMKSGDAVLDRLRDISRRSDSFMCELVDLLMCTRNGPFAPQKRLVTFIQEGPVSSKTDDRLLTLSMLSVRLHL